MNKKYTFTQLCETYHKIEIPIIQRDYAQGRNTVEVQRIREKFIDDYLIPAITEGKAIELDFVYGSVLTEIRDEIKLKTFIPLDGQQRLTTLFLLFFIVALREGRLAEVKGLLSKFTYETRPSAHDFCQRMLEIDGTTAIKGIRAEIEDSVWFNAEWNNDPTVSGMLNVLDALATNEALANSADGLLDRLLDKELKLISFYFTDLEQFGLTESLYIRMNARGKMLTDFENFKSEFFKIIRYSPHFLEEVKTRIEYDWVENLWSYRTEGTFVIDTPFMMFLRFITEMLYYKKAPFRATAYETDFLDFKVLRGIYSKEENLDFLVFALDHIKNLKQKQFGVLWGSEKLISLSDILADVINGNSDVDRTILLFSALQFCKIQNDETHLEDFVRVVRNLIVNTEDNSRREWPRLIASIHSLISGENVYQVLADLKDDNTLIGFNVSQRKEEVYKSRMILHFPDCKPLLFQIEDHPNLKGNITNMLIAPFADTEQGFQIDLEGLSYDDAKLNSLKTIFSGYTEIGKKDFNMIWGNLLITGLYKLTYESRLVYSGNFKKHPAILLFARNFSCSNQTLREYIAQVQKDFVNNLKAENEDFSAVRNVKQQLYLYYIIHEQIYGKAFDSFFKNYNFNFGWLAKENGYKSHFSAGIEHFSYSPDENPIFQLYNSQFRYNSGINESNTLDIEIIGRGGTKREPFKLIQEWANN